MAIFKDRFDLFYKGKSSDVRMQDPAMSFISSGFDIHTHPKRLTPFRAMTPDEDTTMSIVAFGYLNSVLRGLGLKTATNLAKISRSQDGPLAGTWTADANGEATSGTDSRKVFLPFHNYFYGLALDVGIWKFGDVTSSPTFTTTDQAVTGTNTCQGIVTSDDLLLIPYDNKIAKKDGAAGSWVLGALVLPSDRVITDVIELDGNTVAVATKPLTGMGKSLVYLWDKVNVDPFDFIDFGEGDLLHIDLIGGEMIGIMRTSQAITAIRQRLIVKGWLAGKTADILLEVESDDSTFTLHGNHTKVKDGDKIFFGLRIKLDGVTYYQMACVGRKDKDYPIAFSLAQLVDNDVAVTSIDGAFKLADYFFVAHNANGSVNRTSSTDVYTLCTAVYITQKIDGTRQSPDFGRQYKTLKMAGVETVALPADVTMVLAMRKDAETSWSTVQTYTTQNGMGFEAGILADGTEFGTCKEFQFKLTTVGASVGAKGEPTAIVFGYEVAGGDVLPS